MKLVRDGKVAVLVSPGSGAGWTTWCGEEHLPDALFDADIVKAILAEDVATANRLAHDRYKDCYHGGIHTLKVEWVPVGTRFYIREYNGNEQIIIVDDDFGFTA